jgi:hypothetical protein
VFKGTRNAYNGFKKLRDGPCIELLKDKINLIKSYAPIRNTHNETLAVVSNRLSHPKGPTSDYLRYTLGLT